MTFLLPVIVRTGNTILQELDESDNKYLDENNYKKVLHYEARDIIAKKLNNPVLNKYRDINIQYKIISEIFNIDHKLEILEEIYKSSKYIELFGDNRFKLYPLFFPNISVNFIGYYLWDFIFEFESKFFTSIKTFDSNKTELYNLFDKLICENNDVDDLIYIDLDNPTTNKYKIYFPYFEPNIYVAIKNINEDNYDDLIENIDNKRTLTNDYNGIYVLIIDHTIENKIELNQLCEENDIVAIYLND
jgi:hypothetical protein